jgi:hypothetical protein
MITKPNMPENKTTPIADSGSQGGMGMWPSETWASRIYDLANIGLIVGLVIGIVATVLVVWMGNVKETYLRKQLADTAERAAGAEKSANDALIEQERIRQENIILQSKLLTLQKQSEARRLTGEQKANLTKILSQYKGGIAVVSAIVDPEASDFANDFDSAFKNANWETLRITNRISSKFGLAVVTVEGTVLPNIKIVSDALTSIGVPHDVLTFKNGDASTSPAFQAGYLYLVVEHKPLPVAKELK